MRARSGVLPLLGLVLAVPGCGLGHESAEDVRALRQLAYLRGAVVLMRDALQEAELYRQITSEWDVPMTLRVMLLDRGSRQVYPPTLRPDGSGPFHVILILERVDPASGQPRFGSIMGFSPIALENLALLVPADASAPGP
jgi:hypothetical protein